MVRTRGARVCVGLAAFSTVFGIAIVIPTTFASAAPVRTHVEQTAPIAVGDDEIVTRNPERFAVPNPDAGTSGHAFTYPPTIGVGSQALVADVDVELNLTHERSEDLRIVLPGPDGRQVTLMANAGGDASYADFLTFDDEADAAIPDDGPLSQSVYRPAAYGGGDTANTSLSTFEGMPATGQWRLYVDDDDQDNVGRIFGWSLG